jgi:phosphatidylserine decarboxylase
MKSANVSLLVRRVLKSLSIKQGRKYDDPASASQIQDFINFHQLDMSEVLLPLDKFRNFNEFFYRALKPDARPCSGPNEPKIVVSPADCRSVVFDRMSDATSIWVKGREFSVERLLGNAYPEDAARYKNGALAVFRLAPQDYHRFHIPVDGVMGEPKTIEGEYYTVNPMAIRSALDVYGENVRILVPIDSVAHGRVMVICVGAMMVGSTVITRKAGEKVSRAEELGYFKFGGSTLLVLFEQGMVNFDSDLVDNSKGALETLVCTLPYSLPDFNDTNSLSRSAWACQLATAPTSLSMNRTCPRRLRISRLKRCKTPSAASKAAWRLLPTQKRC